MKCPRCDTVLKQTDYGMAGFVILAYLTWGWMNGIWIGNRPIFFLGILLVVFGAQTFSLGLIGELFTRSFSDRYDYDVRTELGVDGERQ